MDSKELESLELKFKPIVDRLVKRGSGWVKWINGAPSRICSLDITRSLYWQKCGIDENGKPVEAMKREMAEDEKKIRPLLNKNDWEYWRGYCPDGRFQKWVSSMQDKAPEIHPVEF